MCAKTALFGRIELPAQHTEQLDTLGPTPLLLQLEEGRGQAGAKQLEDRGRRRRLHVLLRARARLERRLERAHVELGFRQEERRLERMHVVLGFRQEEQPFELRALPDQLAQLARVRARVRPAHQLQLGHRLTPE